MKTKNSKAWSILTPDEQMVLNLTVIHGKSSWEIGEIMGRAHFKLLEIQKRAIKFFEIFTAHYETYGELFPLESVADSDFREYFTEVIENRKIPREAVKNMYNSNVWDIKDSRYRLLVEGMKKLQKSKNQCDRDLFNLIKEFDAWNNHRVLPESIQEPSAYKRRNKAREAKYLRNMSKIPKISLDFIEEKYGYNGKFQKMFIALFSNEYEGGYKIVPVKYNHKNLTELTRIFIYAFDKEVLAVNFANLVVEYLQDKGKTPVSGQKFWPKFRDVRKYAINFLDMENVSVFRKSIIRRLDEIGI